MLSFGKIYKKEDTSLKYFLKICYRATSAVFCG